jgi:hypothetical protein
MASLQELMELGGFGETEKVANDQSTEELDALAAKLGLFDKTAEDDEGSKHEKEESEEEEAKEEEKKGSVSLSGLYDTLFPEDGVLNKTAAEQQQMVYEESLGSRAYDFLSDRWDKRIEKLAAEVLTGGATLSAPTAAEHDGNPHTDVVIPQAQKTNKPSNAKDKIDTTPTVTDEVHKGDNARVSGTYQQKHAAIQQAALRKAFILSQLED